MATTPINSPQHGKERLDKFFNQYPTTKVLKIQPITLGDQGANGRLLDVFDSDDVKAALGVTRFNLLMTPAWVKQVYSVGHRNWPFTHAETAKQGAEVHCIAASDLDRFLKAGN